MRALLPPLALAAALLLAVGPASAAYVVTPLQLTASASQAEVGETITFSLAPENETTATAWGGRTATVVASYDRAEGSDPDAPTSDETDTYARDVIVDELALADDATGSFTWTVPEELDGKNVAVLVESDEGTLLAQADVAVGDAPPVMKTLGGDGEPEPVQEGEGTPGDGVDLSEEENGAAGGADTPSIDVVVLVGALGLLALALRRR